MELHGFSQVLNRVRDAVRLAQGRTESPDAEQSKTFDPKFNRFKI